MHILSRKGDTSFSFKSVERLLIFCYHIEGGCFGETVFSDSFERQTNTKKAERK